MTDSEGQLVDAPAQPPRREGLHAVRDAFLGLTLVCAAFSSAGALTLLYMFHRHPGLREQDIIIGLYARVGFFALIALAIAIYFLRRQCIACSMAAAHLPWLLRYRVLGLAAVAVFAGALLVPHLDVYPWAGPDEMHHLVVAKNLAVHGAYASGNPESGFRLFDTFDSVGPAVIFPVAAALRTGGVSLAAGRMVMPCFFFFLCVMVFVFFRPLFGDARALAAAFMTPAAASSIYLGRTLYGEVPAMAFLLLGLWLWRRALRGPRAAAWGLLSGAALGLVLLSKTIFFLMAFAFFGAVILDRAAGRRIGWVALLTPPLGALAPLGLWWGYQQWAGVEERPLGDATLGLYRHYLIFGIEPIAGNVRTLLENIWMIASALVGTVAALPMIFRRRYDPPAIVCLFLAALFAFWWVFFTPGQLQRYLWMPYVTAAALTGALAWRWLEAMFDERGRAGKRALHGLALLLLLTPTFGWVMSQAQQVYTNREMAQDYAVADAVAALPEDARVSTFFYPLRPTLSFLLGRNVVFDLTPEIAIKRNDAAVGLEQDVTPPEGVTARRIGRYMWWEWEPGMRPPLPEEAETPEVPEAPAPAEER